MTLGRVLKVGEMLKNTRLTYLASIYDSSPLSTRRFKRPKRGNAFNHCFLLKSLTLAVQTQDHRRVINGDIPEHLEPVRDRSDHREVGRVTGNHGGRCS